MEEDDRLDDLDEPDYYENFDRGLTEDECGTVYQCDMSFLEAVLQDLDLLAGAALLECMAVKSNQDRWNNALKNIMVEIHRLIEHPELFLDGFFRDQFFYPSVVNFCRLFKRRRDSKEESLVNQINSLLQEQHHWPLDPDRLPWHQFLHHCGPDFLVTSPCPIPAVNELGLRQYIPPSGQFLLRGWENDIRRYKRAIYPGRRAETSSDVLNLKGEKAGNRTLGGWFRLLGVNTIIDAPESFEEGFDDASPSLESLSYILGRMAIARDEDGDIADPNDHPYISITHGTIEELKRTVAQGKARAEAQNNGTDPDPTN